jgi:hypothetical protein
LPKLAPEAPPGVMRFQVFRVSNSDARMLGMPVGALARYVSMTNGHTLPDIDSDGEITGPIPAGCMFVFESMHLIRKGRADA